MTDDSHVWPYWSVDLPGLNQENATVLLRWAQSRNIALGGIIVDPAHFFTTSMDEATVEALLVALRFAIDSDALPLERVIVIRGFVDQLADWMDGREIF